MALRCFIAVEIDAAIRQMIGEVVGSLRKTGADVKWVAEKNIHITLKFLGNTEESLVGTVRESLKKKVSNHSPLSITISGVGAFPDIRRPRVIWVGIGDSPALKDLQRDVEKEMVGLGFTAEERPFSPHLTIGRIRSPKGMPAMQKELEKIMDTRFPDLEVKGITLMKSELKSGGPEYSVLAEIPCGGEKNV
ncbi:MAG: RNA 2',3'-cyclic phosphodiesterase [Nitrospirae bacterium]|nr:RNA 2',3'-cyclic phosphodiesterase [Nitrospirota bacterium]